MSSNNKQQKRAKRAAAKAKQNRVNRSRPPMVLPPIGDFYMHAMEQGLNDELFERMLDAEDISLRYMLEVFLDDRLLLMVVQNYDPQDLEDYVYAVLTSYRIWSTDATPEEAFAWAKSEEVLEAYMKAVQIKMITAGMDDEDD